MDAHVLRGLYLFGSGALGRAFFPAGSARAFFVRRTMAVRNRLNRFAHEKTAFLPAAANLLPDGAKRRMSTTRHG